MKLTPAEQEAEMAYRLSERVGILADDRTPTPEQMAMAAAEALEWHRRYLAESEPQVLLI